MVCLVLCPDVMVDRETDFVALHHDLSAPLQVLDPSVPPAYPAAEQNARLRGSMHAIVHLEMLPGVPDRGGHEGPCPRGVPAAALSSREGRRADVVTAARFWDGLLEGAFDIGATAAAGPRLSTTLRAGRPSEQRRAKLRERAILARVITGELQKSVALDLHLAPSTVATDFARVRAKIGIHRSSPTIPLPVVVLAQKALGVAPSADLEIEESGDDGSVVIRAKRLDYQNCPSLTQAERAVAQLVAEGFTRKDIARSRDTSVHTVANQVSAVLTRLRVTGRFALIRIAS
jgi:DNA-binding CsgD family transcriptional regulator